MWQRKQTLFLVCSIVAIAICLFEPVGVAYTTTGLGEGHLLMNLGLQNAGNMDVMPVWPLFALATIAGVLSTVGIFLFRNRKMQMRTCSGAMASNLVWYVCHSVHTIGFGNAYSICSLPAFGVVYLLVVGKERYQSR